MKHNDQRGQMARQTFYLILSTVIATCLVIFGLILPAYYSVDPLGWGAKLGINGFVNQLKNNDLSGLTLKPKSSEANSSGKAQETNSVQPIQLIDPLSVRQDTVELTIPAKQSLDYRLAMERDYELDYAWATNGKNVYTELRGEPSEGTAPSKIFGKLTHKAGKGFFIVPFNGQFGWHWQNKTDQPLTLRLTTKGHYQVVGQLVNPTSK